MFNTQEAVQAELDYRREKARGLYRAKAAPRSRDENPRVSGLALIKRLRSVWSV